MENYIAYFSALWVTFLFGAILNNKEIIRSFMCLELSILATNLNFILTDFVVNNVIGRITSLIILSIGAGETALVLGLIAILHGRMVVITLNNLTKG